MPRTLSSLERRTILDHVLPDIRSGRAALPYAIGAIDDRVRREIATLIKGRRGARHIRIVVTGRPPAYGCTPAEMGDLPEQNRSQIGGDPT